MSGSIVVQITLVVALFASQVDCNDCRRLCTKISVRSPLYKVCECRAATWPLPNSARHPINENYPPRTGSHRRYRRNVINAEWEFLDDLRHRVDHSEREVEDAVVRQVGRERERRRHSNIRPEGPQTRCHREMEGLNDEQVRRILCELPPTRRRNKWDFGRERFVPHRYYGRARYVQ